MEREHFWRMFLEEKLTDITLHVGGNAFKCHRIILAASPGYFGSIFNSKMKECEIHDINIGLNVSKDSFLDVLYYLYTGKTRKVQTHRIFEILNCCNYLQLPGLEKSISTDFTSNTTSEEITDLIKTLSETNVIFFPNTFIQIIAKNFYQLINLDEIKSLSFSSLIKILSHPDLKINEEGEG